MHFGKIPVTGKLSRDPTAYGDRVRGPIPSSSNRPTGAVVTLATVYTQSGTRLSDSASQTSGGPVIPETRSRCLHWVPSVSL